MHVTGLIQCIYICWYVLNYRIPETALPYAAIFQKYTFYINYYGSGKSTLDHSHIASSHTHLHNTHNTEHTYTSFVATGGGFRISTYHILLFSTLSRNHRDALTRFTKKVNNAGY